MNGEEMQKKSQEDTIKAFIVAYIDAYMDNVEEQNIKESDFPLFYTNYPYDVTGYILPDNSLCVLFRGSAPTMRIQVSREDFDSVDKEIIQKKFHHILCYSTSKAYTKEEAKKTAIADVKSDVENARMLSGDEVDAISRAELLRTLRLIKIIAPWIGGRKPGNGTLRAPMKSEKLRFADENLAKKPSEEPEKYFLRLRQLEAMLLGMPKQKADEVVIKPPIPPPIPPPPSQPSPATNISIEIKQPEGKQAREMVEDRTDMDILRIKKTLLLQTTDIEELRRKVSELTNKMANYEQMRQTVFRMNRKVYDNDVRMQNIEKANRETLNKMTQMQNEQKEENVKVRRFITEKAQKARNQALILGFIALTVSVVTLILGIPLLVEFWDIVGSFFGF